MLPKRTRLSRHDFPDTRTLKRASSKHFSISYGNASPGGVAVVISKKVARLSVARHLLKRRLMSLLRPYASHDRVIIVHARAGAATVPYAVLQDELNSLLGSILPKPSTHV